MEALRISLNDYILSGGGANGESYVLKTDPTVMLKLYFPGKIRQPLDEMILARKVFEAGIPTPEPGDYVVTEDGRYGIRFTASSARNPIPEPLPTIPGTCRDMLESLPECALTSTPHMWTQRSSRTSRTVIAASWPKAPSSQLEKRTG